MVVYRTKHDHAFRYFLNEHEQDTARLRMDWDGTPRAGAWEPPPVYVYKPKLKAGAFWHYDGGYWITSPEATDILGDELEAAGELLPLPYQGRTYHLLNVTECVDCLDHSATERCIAPDGIPLHITRYAFDPRRISESSRIFKIPEEAKTSIFVVEGLLDEDLEFRNVLVAEKLPGLVFQKVWSDED